MIPAEWTFRLPPLPGELLSSCLARNALAHGTSPYRFLNLLWEHDPVWNRDFDRDPASLGRAVPRRRSPDWLDDIAGRLVVDRAAVEGATLAADRDRLAGPRRLGGDTPLVLSAGVHHRTRTRHALQFCPGCLGEGTPHFRKAWRLGFVVACARHGTALSDACPHCDAPLTPHRSTTMRMTDCHRCGRSIILKQREGELIAGLTGAVRLQGWMLALLDGADVVAPHPWHGRDAFDAVRALLAVAAAAPVRILLRAHLGLGGMDPPGDRMRFEHARLAVRAPWLETVGAWMADWPRSFHDGADAAGLSRLTFARSRMPAALADEVARLPAGHARDRTWVPVLDEPALRRLRRTDRAAYSRVRAARVLEHCDLVG